MTKILDITNRKHEPVLKHVGRSGKKYIFRWDSGKGRYAYEPQNQEEVDDLMEGAKHWNMHHFSFTLPEIPKAPVKRTRKKRKPPIEHVELQKQTMGSEADTATL